jgi:hypothetical protein
MGLSRHARAVLTAVLVAWVATSSVRGARADAAAGATSMVVFVDDAPATQGRSAAVLGAIRAELVDLDVAVRVISATGPPDVRGRMERVAGEKSASGRTLGALWLDLATPDLLLFIANADGTRVLIRRIRVVKGAEGAAIEEMGIVVRSTVSALLEGRAIGMEGAASSPTPLPQPGPPPSVLPGAPASETPPPVARPVPDATFAPRPAPSARSVVGPPPTPTRSEAASLGRLRASIDYVGTVFTSPGSWQSGLLLGARYVTSFRGYVGAGYTLFPTAVTGADGVVLGLQERPIDAVLGYERLVVPRLRLAGEIVLVADVATRSSQAVPSGFHSTPDATRALWAASPRVRGELRAFAGVWVGAGVGADVGLGNFAYVVSPDTGAVVRPLPVRPRVELGVTVDLF